MTAFLTEMPAGPATQARRVRVIDTIHQAASFPLPGDGPEVDLILGRTTSPPRFDPQVVGRALGMIPVGGWPAGIVGRRDAAIVALVCSAGLTRTQVHHLRTSASYGPAGENRNDPAGLLARLARTEAPGSCPACAFTRWLRTALRVEQGGWRHVRAELADYGEILANQEPAHDCTQPLPLRRRPGPAVGERTEPLICAIDHHGVPQTGYPLSTRSVTAIISARLTTAAISTGQEQEPAIAGFSLPGLEEPNRPGLEERRRVNERFAPIEAALDQAEADADVLLARIYNTLTNPDR